MEHITFFRNIVTVLLIILSLSASAQNTTIMDYQIMATHPITGEILVNKTMNVRIEIRLNAEDGKTVWSKEEKVKSSNAGICTIQIDFSEIDFSLGTYFIKAFIDGKPVGSSQINYVPFAVIANSVTDVITKHNLIGTWKKADVEGECLLIFNQEGTFVYQRISSDSDNSFKCSGTWKLDGLGHIIFNVLNIDASYSEFKAGKYIVSTVYDKDDKKLYTKDFNRYFFESGVFQKLIK